ncbi:MAG: hypothetical protein DSZ00_01690 [Gammaproteobacteria bacterium]|nr:MAG: hypothetical protein DSZ00_01690 [Gammaproteobacteria bacterium]
MAGSARTEQVFCITDLIPEQADPGQLLALNRGHWSIENRLHWVHDVTFDEELCHTHRERHRATRSSPDALDGGDTAVRTP